MRINIWKNGTDVLAIDVSGPEPPWLEQFVTVLKAAEFGVYVGELPNVGNGRAKLTIDDSKIQIIRSTENN